LLGKRIPGREDVKNDVVLVEKVADHGAGSAGGLKGWAATWQKTQDIPTL
jgi:hypothetical protein